MTTGLDGQDGRVLTIVLGHFPPPVHGMAVAVERLAVLLDERARRAGGRCVRLTTVVSSPRGSLTYHVGRVKRVLAGICQLWSLRRDHPAVYVSCDAGPGMLYTMALLGCSRVLGLRLWLHHHSYAYLDNPSDVFRGLLRIGGANTTHLVGCADMARDLRSASRRPLHITELPILYAVELPRTPVTRRRRPKAVVLGHLSNLSAEKGLREVFATFAALRRRGVPTELVLAGPPATPDDAKLVDELLSTGGERVRYLGPVYGPDRERFFEEIDVFLFPSRYRNESFGLVVGEALVRGVEIVAYACGCLNSEVVGAAGLLLPRNRPFAEPAAAWIAKPRPASQQSHFAAVHEKRAEAEVKAQAVASQMTLCPEVAGSWGRVRRRR
jgi:glycosyltransferase involved in cell wall biosynthesis